MQYLVAYTGNPVCLYNNEAAGRNLTPSFIQCYIMCNSPTGSTEKLPGSPGPTREKKKPEVRDDAEAIVTSVQDHSTCKGLCIGPLEATSLSLLRETVLIPLILQGKTYQFCGSDCVKMCIGTSEASASGKCSACSPNTQESLPPNGWNKSGFDFHALTDHNKIKRIGTQGLKIFA